MGLRPGKPATDEQRDPRDTKERILDAAEALFAAQGFSATSLRNVIGEAGVNLAAVHYHYGSKEELIRAVFARRFDPLNKERLALLSDLKRSRDGKHIRIEDILEILMLPVMKAAREQIEGWSVIATLVGRVHTEPELAIREIFYSQFEEVGDSFVDALGAELPHLSREELFYRFHFGISAMAATLVQPEEVRHLSKGRIDPSADPLLFVRRWVAFVAAGLRAPALGNHGGGGAS
ncbi:MAG TPA: TetR/AcrR family transcriptional regulator [Candidatus Binatia bacterium]|nr:TetR/AcrR family transcriptional regulator [Candidatus Binatia bacterium]